MGSKPVDKDEKTDSAPAETSTSKKAQSASSTDAKKSKTSTTTAKTSSSSSSSEPNLTVEIGTGSSVADIATTAATSTSNKKKGAASSGAVTPTPSTASGGGIDAHPYARSSVIEVLHGVKEDNEDHWLSSSSEEEEDEDVIMSDEQQTAEGEAATPEEKDGGQQDTTNDNKNKSKNKKDSASTLSVRLCDVIDRIGDNTTGWRYYVHYRDFNRRMDEWIGIDRIVSPPSVGNRKARELKKQEEREKRKQARIEERNAELAKAADLTAPRASRRRSNMNVPGTTGATTAATTASSAKSSVAAPAGGGEASSAIAAGASTTHGTAVGADGATADASKTTETPRLTRRRKSTDTEKASAGADNKGGASLAAEKEVVTIKTTAAVEQTQIGEHVVATIPAQEMDEHEGLDEASLREHEEVTKVKNVALLELGPHRMETWYFSPLPKELLSEKGFVEILYVCEFSLHMFPRKSELLRYQARELPKNLRHPPGNEIYRNGNLSMFEVDGFEERMYCQNLCYIAKLFLDHKTLYFDVDPFLFYVLCEVDNRGYHPVGYFSKEKYSDVGYNLACILTFPSHQRKGYGRFLIAFSYELSKKEEKVGSPEKPMSDLGQQAYKPYWMSTIVDFLYKQEGDASSMSIMDISKKTSIMAEDIVFTLNQLGILKIINGVYFIAAEDSLLERLAKKHPVKNPIVDPTKLHWTPFVTDIKRDKFSIHSKKPSVEGDEQRGKGGF